MNQVPDETFASEVLGKGAAIIPNEGAVYAPFDGTVTTVFDTKHAIGLTGDNGVELLIHMGINTVELNGKYYDVKVAEGDRVTTGQLLANFDIKGIADSGYNLTTPVIVTNSDQYQEIRMLKTGELKAGEELLEVK